MRTSLFSIFVGTLTHTTNLKSSFRTCQYKQKGRISVKFVCIIHRKYEKEFESPKRTMLFKWVVLKIQNLTSDINVG